MSAVSDAAFSRQRKLAEEAPESGYTPHDLARVRSSARPAVLNALKHHYQLLDLTPSSLGKLSGLGKDRIRKLGNSVGIEEPWFDEAVILSRCLNMRGIVPLMTLSGDLTDCPTGIAIAADVDAFRAGVRLPLSMACRLAIRFGLADPIELVTTPLEQQVWATLEAGERLGGALICPWCLGERGQHLPTCLPNNLWGRRDTLDKSTLGHLPRPKGTGQRRAPAAVGWGLKTVREELMKTQDQFADGAGISRSHYPKVERGELNLTTDAAMRIAAAFKIDMATLYVRPPAD